MRQKIAQQNTLHISSDMQLSFAILQMNAEELIDMVAQKAMDNPFISAKEGYLLHQESFDQEYILNNIQEHISLKEHLMRQINMMSDINIEIATLLTDALDENGYLLESIDSLSKAHQYDEIEIVKTLNKLKTLDPLGAYSSSIEDCLMTQCKERNIYCERMSVLLQNLDCIASNKIDKLSKICECDVDIINKLIALVKSLNPKPGLAYAKTCQRVIIPDIFVLRSHEGFIAAKNSNVYDVFSANTLYRKFEEFAITSQVKIKNKEARLICKAIANRGDIILHAVQAIVERQYEFFAYGSQYIKPMIQQEIADILSVHESTISRIANKYIEFNGRCYQIKFFFSSQIDSAFHENHFSSKAIQEKIKMLIKAEESHAPLSDEKITSLLVQDGVKIARRTVAKYRERIGIAPYHLRRQVFS